MRRLLLAAVLGTAFLLATPVLAGAAERYPIVGFGEQRASVFSNPHWQELGLKHIRLVVGWDALRYKWQRREIDAWMAGAELSGAKVLVAFTRSRAYWRRKVLPSPASYGRWFLRFRERYPSATDFIPWNEANHCSQPTCHKPELAAAYYDTMRSACPECTVVAADVLDTSDMAQWLKAFVKASKHEPRLWGLHNYIDANRFRTRGTRTMLRTVKGTIWFTETGGLVHRKKTSPIKFPDSPAHAALATRWVLERLANLSPRIRRIYLYHFENQGSGATWDSGVLDPHGRPRPAFQVLAKWVARAQRARQTAG